MLQLEVASTKLGIPETRRPQKNSGGMLIPTTAQSKSRGEVVEVGTGRMIGKNRKSKDWLPSCVLEVCWDGSEVEWIESSHLKEDDIVGILESDDIKDLKPQNDRVLIKVAVDEEKTAGGLYLTDASKENLQ